MDQARRTWMRLRLTSSLRVLIHVAIDYWASKNILCSICEQNGDNTSTMDPDNTSDGEFGDWLRLSMDELNAAGYGFTVDPEKLIGLISHSSVSKK